jgi:hypothetical protein
MSYQPTPVEQTLRKFIEEMQNKLGIDVKLEIMPVHEWVVHGNAAIPGVPVLSRAKIVGYTVNMSFRIPEKLNPL